MKRHLLCPGLKRLGIGWIEVDRGTERAYGIVVHAFCVESDP